MVVEFDKIARIESQSQPSSFESVFEQLKASDNLAL